MWSNDLTTNSIPPANSITLVDATIASDSYHSVYQAVLDFTAQPVQAIP